MTPETIETAERGADSLDRLVRRDGVWTSNGLSSDFRHLYAHPNADGIHRVQISSGEHYAHESELAWDYSPNDKVSHSADRTPESEGMK